MDILKKLYENPETFTINKEQLYKKAIKLNPSISKQQVNDFLNKQETKQIFKRIKEPKHYIPISADYLFDNIQIDLTDISNVSTKNKGYKWLFVCVDVFTRKGFAYPMKNKTTKTVVDSFHKFIQNIKPNRIMCDNGSEFISKSFKDICLKNDIKINFVNTNNHLIEHVGNRLGIVDRFIQTLRNKIMQYCTENNTLTFINVLQQLIENINDEYNTGINAVPNEIVNDGYLQVLQLERQNNQYIKAMQDIKKYNINDQVRAITTRNKFTKGSIPTYSQKIYNIIEALDNSYKLNNNKWYKYYQIQSIPSDSIIRPKRYIHKKVNKNSAINKRNKELDKEGINLDNIISGMRTRNRKK